MNRNYAVDTLTILEEFQTRLTYNKLNYVFPEKGPDRRDLYPKFMEFFRQGKYNKVRLMTAGNQVGKTTTACAEIAYHATGLYPDWWEGKRFDKPVIIWVAGVSSSTTREILQDKLLGSIYDMGTGLIPKHCIEYSNRKTGIRDTIDVAFIKHVSGGLSAIHFKSFEQGRKVFQGKAVHVVLLDEECPLDVFDECYARTTTTSGIVILTFTPLLGLTDTVLNFMPDGLIPDPMPKNKFIINVTWDDVPHLTEKIKAEMLEAMPLWQRDARTKGIPRFGSGLIYLLPEEAIFVNDFYIPDHWKRAFGMDFGYVNGTAIVWGAIDPESQNIYVYSEFFIKSTDLAENEAVLMGNTVYNAINTRGIWIKGAGDPGNEGDNKDRILTTNFYRQKGVNILPANNSVEFGIQKVSSLFYNGKLKIFNSCQGIKKEIRLYRRDAKGNVHKSDDHHMDALRYFVTTGVDIATTKPMTQPVNQSQSYVNQYNQGSNTSWMAR